MLRLLIVLLALEALHPAPTFAYVVVPNHHAEFQRAARAAMTCADVVPGRYVVEVTVTSEPYHAEARLLSSPPLLLDTQRCVERAFTTQRYALIRGTERLEAPFVLMGEWP